MELRWSDMGRHQQGIVAASVIFILVAVWWFVRNGDENLVTRADQLELPGPGARAQVVRTPKGSCSPCGGMSRLASSQRHPELVRGLRDSGDAGRIYQPAATADPGRFLVSESPVNGVRNPDWEGVVYGENGSGPYLLISDTAAKSIYRVSAPNPAWPGRVRIEKTYRHDFSNSGNKSGGRRNNVEVASRCAAVNGPLHFVRKEKSPARVYRFFRLADDHVNVPQRVGTVDDSYLSASVFSLDHASMKTASHSVLGVRQVSPGDPGLFLRARSVLTARTPPDNNEGGNIYPFGSAEIPAGAENRTTPRLRHDPAKI